jgi:beta-N-acetylhexosaminidase
VITNAGIFNRAMRAEGILSCGKHFPGYGPAECDPHEFLPVITKSREEMEKSELLPYSALLPELDSVMTCHSNYTAYDPDRGRWPASLSYNIVTKLLRHQYAFDGLAMTDDLDMGAILNEVTFEQAIQEAVRAGNDLVMICHRVEMVELARQHLEGVEEPVCMMPSCGSRKPKSASHIRTISISTASPPSTATSGSCASIRSARRPQRTSVSRTASARPVELY